MLRTYTEEEVKHLFGDPTPYVEDTGRVNKAWELSILTNFPLPKSLPLSWGGTAKTVSCHTSAAQSLKAVLDELAKSPSWSTINDWGGCYMWRMQRGAKVLSKHCWGIAVDLDTVDNPMGVIGHLDPRIVDAFERHGWYWGGNFHGRRRDAMHFELAKVL